MQHQNISSAEAAAGAPGFNTNLPVGTITLLFADIEGSTRLLHQLGDGYAQLLSEYRSLLRSAYQQWNGSEVDTQGDAFFAVFSHVSDAVSAALAVQRALATHLWPDGVSVQVRMGVHTGAPQRAAEGYIGLDVHHAARIMSAGHGGQVLLSQTTHDLVAQSLPRGVGLQDLGNHHLKDLQHPGHLYQLVSTDLPAGFPPLKTHDVHPNNIPVPLTPLIGREHEIASACAFLRSPHGRLLTFTGPGGVGKTRLALQVATSLLNDFADGVSLVLLAPIRDPQFVIPTIARALDVQESADQPLVERITISLAGKHLLLLLDNFEQVVSAAPLLSALLQACPSLKVLVTSREMLRVRGEHEFVVPPLALPDLKQAPTIDALSQVAAVALFVHRAQEVKPDFQLTPANAQVIAQICTRLDGLPLALELAAARLKLLSLQALLARLEHRLQVLIRGNREVAQRQQTLYDTLQWSYELLSQEEQRLFRRLAVFSGGWTLPAAEAVCAAGANGALDVESSLSSLLDKSLVRQSIQTDGELRFSLLETIREFALDCLEKSGEKERLREAHAAYYLALAAQAEAELEGPQQAEWLQQLEQEHDNLRAVLQWALEPDGAGQRSSELALQLGGALKIFWAVRGYWNEGRTYLEQALAATSMGSVSPTRAKALCTTAALASQQDDYEPAMTLAKEGLAQFRALGDSVGIIHSLYLVGAIASNQSDYLLARSVTEEALLLARKGSDRVRIARLLANLGEIVTMQGDYVRAQALFAESLKIQQEIGNKHGIAWCLFKLAWVLIVSQGNLATAHAHLEESRALARELEDKEILVTCLIYSGHIALGQGDPALARSFLEESLASAREIGNLWATVENLCTLAKVAFVQGDYARARACCEEILKGARKIGSKELLACALERLACIGAAQGEGAWAARLGGMAETLRETMGAPITPLERPLYERMIAEARSQVGERNFAATWAQGRTMSPEQALDPLETVMPPQQAPPLPPLPALPPQEISQASHRLARPSPAYPAELTQREVEVLRLVAHGMTNPQIAEQLIISHHTVNTHVSSILSKLGVSSRNAIVHFAFEHHLI